MRKALAVIVVVVGLLGCGQASRGAVDESPPVPPTEPIAEPKAGVIAVQMTSATLADDCGGGPSTPPRPRKSKRKGLTGLMGGLAKSESKSKAMRACEQSSIQLAITAPAGAMPARMVVKSVELLLESGASVGKLEARAPSVWSDAEGYVPWNETIDASQDLSVSYALSQPDWSQVEGRWNKTYTVKAVVSVAGADRTLERTVVVEAPTSLPPNVKT